MDEKTLQRKILKYLDGLGYVWAFKTITTNRRGVPDIIACVDGRFVALEVKAPGKLSTLSDVQQVQINRVNACGGLAVAVDSFHDAQNAILSVDKIIRGF